MRKQKDFPYRKNIRETEIKSKLRDYLADLEGNTKGDSPQTEEDTKEDPSSLLIDIYIRTRFPEGDYPPIGDYLSQRDILALVEMLFDNLLGAWVNKRIVCVGDYSDTLPPEYQSASKTLYDTSYTEVLSLSDCAKQFLENLKSDSDKADAFRVEYSRLLEESFPSDQQHVLLNLTSREYVFGECSSVKELGLDRNS
ncbi:hypothetical protein G7Y89_g3515 [Cudoniella acicularis]|uniref:Uncharacterized protein n=1 Tax=Cudoniella acicularis TaxID=354080 RepID=A0A8H4W5I5_9HELO|nr:hypothetical protein G7Y89_g3515 [Cudoniella acicularis]